MRTSQANRFARWAATAAMVLTCVSAIAYGWRAWQARQEREKAPAVVPQAVQKSFESFSYSKVEGDRTLFTIRASQATEFKVGGQSLLQDVWVTIYGKTGRRFDNIHTRECDYQPTTGRMICAGEVQIDLESAEEASARPGQRAIQIRTARVTFDRETGEARTDQPVEFKFAHGAGRGVGLRYGTREGIARLEKDVELTLTGSRDAARSDPAASAPTKLTGAALEYARDARTMRLLGPVVAAQGTRELRASAVLVQFNPQMISERLVASGRPVLRELGASGETTLAADEMTISLHPGSYPEKVIATGAVAFSAKDASSDDRITARRIEMDLAEGGRQPRQVRATGAVQVASERSAAGGAGRRLETESLQLDFAASNRAAERSLSRAETLAPAVMELRQGEEQSRVRAARVIADFGGRSELRRVAGSGGVDVERRIGRRAPQQTASRDLALQFDTRGEWTEAAQTGEVRFREGARSGQAQQARAVRATETVYLTGGAVLSDAVSRTVAPSIEINQRSGEILAKGGVRTSYTVASQRPDATFVPSFAPQPAHISAEELRASADDGRALYSGKARLWQGDAMIEADTIELRRLAGDERQLHASENVRALFPQTRSPQSPGALTQASAVNGAAARTLWRVRAGQLTYRSGEGKIRLQESVFAEAGVGQIQSQRLDMILATEGTSGQQLTRAEATGGVTVRQGGRRGTAERADYFAAEGKFVLSGGKPTLFDAILGTTTGRQLTFFLADDRILIDSEEGSRTVTRHRVEN